MRIKLTSAINSGRGGGGFPKNVLGMMGTILILTDIYSMSGKGHAPVFFSDPAKTDRLQFSANITITPVLYLICKYFIYIFLFSISSIKSPFSSFAFLFFILPPPQ